MGYDVAKIKKEIAENKRSAVLSRAKLHQMRIKFHTVKRVTSFNSPYISIPLTQFLAMAENILPHDKFVLFKALFRYPIKTNEITEICFDKLSRIFDGRNPAFNYQFANTAQRDDWEQYRQTKLNEPDVWATKGWEFFKSEINSVLVVDVAREQTTELPEPYFYWLPIDDVITYKADPTTGQMDFIVFRRRDEIVVLDDETYRVWDDRKHTGQLVGMPKVEATHDLGYCPARRISHFVRVRTKLRFHERGKRGLLRRRVFARQTRPLPVGYGRITVALPEMRKQTYNRGRFVCGNPRTEPGRKPTRFA